MSEYSPRAHVIKPWSSAGYYWEVAEPLIDGESGKKCHWECASKEDTETVPSFLFAPRNPELSRLAPLRVLTVMYCVATSPKQRDQVAVD